MSLLQLSEYAIIHFTFLINPSVCLGIATANTMLYFASALNLQEASFCSPTWVSQSAPHKCFAGDESSCVSADPGAQPLIRNAVTLGLAAQAFTRDKYFGCSIFCSRYLWCLHISELTLIGSK